MQQQIPESVLVESRFAREIRLVGVNDDRAFEILGRVKALVFAAINGGNFITTDEVADFYEVPVETVRSMMKFNREELNADGIKLLEGAEYRKVRLLIHRTSTSANKTMIWTPKSVLRAGMMLTQSQVAKAVRDALINMVEAVGSLAIQQQDPVQMTLPVLPSPENQAVESIEFQRMRLEIELAKARCEETKARCEEKRLDLMSWKSTPAALGSPSSTKSSPIYEIEPEIILPLSANKGVVQFLSRTLRERHGQWVSLPRLKQLAGESANIHTIRGTANRMAARGEIEKRKDGVMQFRWKGK